MRRLFDYLATGLVFIVIIFLAAWFAGLSGETHHGPFKALDGDSLKSGSKRFRLEGIDAPEYRQSCVRNGAEWPCGREAARYLRNMVSRGNVTCRSYGEDKYQRLLVRCRQGDTDINRAMVEAGLAVAYGDYLGAEAEARSAARGLWAGKFERPQEWREINGGAEETESGNDLLRRFGRVAGWLAESIESLGAGSWFSGEAPKSGSSAE